MKQTILILGLVSGCAADPLLTSTTTKAMTGGPKENLLCESIICFLHRTWDYDNDGVGDADELAVGTDPNSASSRPDLHSLLGLIGQRRLPSFEAGQSMMVSLPTVGPDGQPVFGGEASLPARSKLLDKIGIKLPDGSIDLTDGFTLTRSLDGHGLDFHKPPWVVPGPPKADHSRDGSTDGAATASALEGLKLYDFAIQDSSNEGGYGFSNFSFTDQRGYPWKVTTQSSPGYSTATATTTASDLQGAWSVEKTITVTQSTDEHGTVITKTTKTTSTVDGKSSTKVTEQTEASSSDGRQKYYNKTTTDEDGTTTSESTECFDGECTGTGKPPEEAPEPTDDQDQTAFQDPEYFEYQPSPEVVDAVMSIHAGPVHTVDPLDDTGESFEYVPSAQNGNFGVISLYSPDAVDTAATGPTVLHMPRGGDYSQNPPAEVPPPDEGVVGGKCLYCNQGQ